MKIHRDLVICEQCDSVHRRLPLQPGEQAHCLRCEALLYRHGGLNVDRWLALTLAAAVAYLIANFTPVISITLQGHYNSTTLWQAAMALAYGSVAPIAVASALAMVVVPGLQIALLLWLLGHARFGKRAPGFAVLMRALQVLRPWSMVEVCVLGLLVALIKLSSDLDVSTGAGIWATGVLMLLIVMVANRDVHWLWEMTAAETNA